MNNEAIKLYSAVSFEKGNDSTPLESVRALNLEAATLGYAFDASLMDALASLPETRFLAIRDDLNKTLIVLSGAKANHARLFNGFPYNVPDQHEYMADRVAGVLEQGLQSNNITILSCGHAINLDRFDLTDFGMCPICQKQVPELSSGSGKVFPLASTVTPMKVLTYLDADGMRGKANDLLSRQSSLSADEKLFLQSVIAENGGLTVPETIYKENLPFVFDALGAEALAGHLSGATDVMRLAYYVSDNEADLSLKENVKFKLSTKNRKAFLRLLDSLGHCKLRMAEDMMRNRERWLRLGELLNPGSAANRKRYPNVAAAFDALRNDPKGIPTFNRKAEQHIRNREVTPEFVRLLAIRPTELVRKLDFILREGGQETLDTLVHQVLPTALKKVPERTLLEVMKYLPSRNSLTDRMFFPKGSESKVQIVPDKRIKLDESVVCEIELLIRAELLSRYRDEDQLGAVYIDPALKGMLLPFNRRGDSSTTTPVLKGSRYPFSGDVLRMFVHWRNGDHSRVDVDLSAVMFGEDFTNKGHVAFTNLSSAGTQHSGDVQDAPNGASEFIDFDLDILRRNRNARYVAMSIISYTGQPFGSFPCFAGFMERDKLRSGAVYEPETVRLKFDVTAKTTSHIPLIFDLQTMEIIFADLAGSGRSHMAVAGQSDKFTALTRNVLTLPQRKPTLFDFLHLKASARGTIVEDSTEAETVFSVNDDIDRLLAV